MCTFLAILSSGRKLFIKNIFREIEKEVINWYSKPHDNYECAESSLAVSSKLDRKCCLSTFSSFRQWKHMRLFCDTASNEPTTCFALLDVSWRGQIYKNNTILQIIIEIVKNYSSSIHSLHERYLKLSRYRMPSIIYKSYINILISKLKL